MDHFHTRKFLSTSVDLCILKIGISKKVFEIYVPSKYTNMQALPKTTYVRATAIGGHLCIA